MLSDLSVDDKRRVVQEMRLWENYKRRNATRPVGAPKLARPVLEKCTSVAQERGPLLTSKLMPPVVVDYTKRRSYEELYNHADICIEFIEIVNEELTNLSEQGFVRLGQNGTR